MEELIKKLESNGMQAYYFTNSQEAKAHILNMIPSKATVGIGGSVTVREMGLLHALAERGMEYFDHWAPGLSSEEIMEVKRKMVVADYFLTSTNGLTRDGKLVNIDNTGNRVAAMIFGPKHVIVVAGVNKIVDDAHAAIRRIKEEAVPKNTSRRGDNTPCAKGETCPECNSPDRLCRVISIIEKKTKGVRTFTVVIVGEPLGY
jgi:L-lactate utilization protein LutB